jgi:hypothetical protein
MKKEYDLIYEKLSAELGKEIFKIRISVIVCLGLFVILTLSLIISYLRSLI